MKLLKKINISSVELWEFEHKGKTYEIEVTFTKWNTEATIKKPEGISMEFEGEVIDAFLSEL